MASALHPAPLTPDQYAALDDLAGRFKAEMPADFLTRPGALEEIISFEWWLYLNLLCVQGKAKNAVSTRRQVVKQIAKQIGHKLTIEDAKRIYGELPAVLVDLFTADLEQMQAVQPRQKRGPYKLKSRFRHRRSKRSIG